MIIRNKTGLEVKLELTNMINNYIIEHTKMKANKEAKANYLETLQWNASLKVLEQFKDAIIELSTIKGGD